MPGLTPCGTDDLIVGTYNIMLQDPDTDLVYDLGATTGGVTLTQSNTYNDVRNDQTTTRQTRIRTQQDWTITTTMRNVTFDKLRLVYGQKQGWDGGSNLCIVEDTTGCTFPEIFRLIVSGPGPGCGCRNFYFKEVSFTPDTVEYTMQTETPVELAVEFAAFADCDGVIGCMHDGCDNLLAEVTSVDPDTGAVTIGTTVFPSVEQTDGVGDPYPNYTP